MVDSPTRLRGRPRATSARVTRQVDAALKPVLAGDDRLLAVARVVTGPPPSPAAVAVPTAMALVSIIAPTLAHRLPASPFVPSGWLSTVVVAAGDALLVAVMVLAQRPRFIAVSGRRLIFARLTRFRQRPVRIIAVPLSAAEIHSYRGDRYTTSVTLKLPEHRRVRLHAYRRRQADLEQVLMRARAAGVTFAAKPNGSGAH